MTGTAHLSPRSWPFPIVFEPFAHTHHLIDGVTLQREGWSAQTYGPIWASNDATGEEKFFLSNAAANTTVEMLVRVAFRRAHVLR